jgi:hypothetical protein
MFPLATVGCTLLCTCPLLVDGCLVLLLLPQVLSCCVAVVLLVRWPFHLVVPERIWLIGYRWYVGGFSHDGRSVES